MKFYGIPNEVVTRNGYNRFTKKKRINVLFRFDDNGEYETEDLKLIESLKQHFKYDEAKAKMKCKHCEFETENKGELMSHYRNHHGK